MGYQDALDRAGYTLRDKVGKVLSSGSEIMNLRDRASQFRATDNAQVNAQAEAVVAKANGLLTNYKSIEADSISALSDASAMQTKMATDPIWKAINSGTVDQNAWAYVARAKDYAGEAVALTQRLTSAASRADSHLSALGSLRSDESDLENFAQGKGIKATFGGIFSLGSDYLAVAKWSAIAIGGFFVWDLVKPFVAGKRRS